MAARDWDIWVTLQSWLGLMLVLDVGVIIKSRGYVLSGTE